MNATTPARRIGYRGHDDIGLGGEVSLRRRRSRFTSAAIVIFTILVLAYAFALLREQSSTASSSTAPLQVRTDRMRGQPCHVADKTIMGDCSADEIAALQREFSRAR